MAEIFKYIQSELQGFEFYGKTKGCISVPKKEKKMILFVFKMYIWKKRWLYVKSESNPQLTWYLMMYILAPQRHIHVAAIHITVDTP